MKRYNVTKVSDIGHFVKLSDIGHFYAYKYAEPATD